MPNLDNVEIKLGIIDKDNVWHRLIVATVEKLFSILKIERKMNYYKSIFVIIRYENKVVFTGNLNFEGIE